MKLKKLVAIALGIFLLTFGGTVAASTFIAPRDQPEVAVITNEQALQQNGTASTQSQTSQSTDPTATTDSSQTPTTTDNNTSTTPSPAAATPTTPSAPSTPTPNPTPTPTPTPTPPPPAPAPTCGNGGACTAAQVKTHNKQSDCWVIYSGKVYNVTSYVPTHNGGAAAFNSTTCGADIATYMTGSASVPGVGKHKHSTSAYRQLDSFYIANLQ